MANIENLIWESLKDEIERLETRIESVSIRYERAEISDSIPAYTLATAPLAAQGGLGDGTSYITTAWISNGRKAGEGAGAGTGVIAIYQASTDQWLRLTDYSVVVV